MVTEFAEVFRHDNEDHKLLLFDFYGTIVTLYENIKPMPGIQDFLKLVKKQNVILGVVTSCENKEVIDIVLKREELDDIFSFVITENESLKHDERIKIAIETAENIINNRYKRQNVFLFDDDVARINVSKRMGIVHVSIVEREEEKVTKTLAPDYIIQDFRDKKKLEIIFNPVKREVGESFAPKKKLHQ